MSKELSVELVKQLVLEIPPEDIADAAANRKAECDIFTCKVHDEVMREITVGYALVIVAYGSEGSIDRIKQALTEASTR